MKNLLILLLFPLFSTAQQASEQLLHLASYMEGSFNSAEQAAKDTSYFNIRLDMKRIWNDRTDGVWLYVEQAVNKEGAKPYRQRVYQLQQSDDKTFTSTIYKIDSAEQYIGLHLKEKTKINHSEIELLPGCALTLTFDGENYKGETKKGECKNAWGKANYATSEVEIFKDRMVSWDRGWNDKDEYVWGAEHAGYVFKKQ